VIVADPCPWTPELPFRYRLIAELHRAGALLAYLDREVGFRPIAPRGRRLLLSGKPWALRAAGRKQVSPDQLEAFREASLGLVVRDPDEALLAESDATGVPVVAALADPTPASLAALASHASLLAVVLPRRFEADLARLRPAARNTIFVLIDPASVPLGPCVRLIDEFDETPAPDGEARWVARAAALDVDPLGERRVCDDLQAETAGRDAWAGYLVGAPVWDLDGIPRR
jgi:hypothetical protein